MALGNEVYAAVKDNLKNGTCTMLSNMTNFVRTYLEDSISARYVRNGVLPRSILSHLAKRYISENDIL